MDAETYQGVRACLESLRERDDAPKGLAVGADAPDFVLSEAWGAPFWLREALESGPAIIVFYRGGWCPYCEITLAAWQERQPVLRAKSVHLVAISPQYPEATGTIVKKLGLEFPVLCDPGNRVARKYGLVFKQTGLLHEVSERSGTSLSECNKDCSQQLPVPATYLVSQQSTLLYRHFDVDFTTRAEPRDVLEQLDQEGV